MVSLKYEKKVVFYTAILVFSRLRPVFSLVEYAANTPRKMGRFQEIPPKCQLLVTHSGFLNSNPQPFYSVIEMENLDEANGIHSENPQCVFCSDGGLFGQSSSSQIGRITQVHSFSQIRKSTCRQIGWNHIDRAGIRRHFSWVGFSNCPDKPI